MCPLRDIFLLLLASACVYCRHIDVNEKNNFGIYGGTPIDITEVPFMALLRYWNDTWWCGATIVDKQFVVTAGHCVDGVEDDYRVTVGTDKAKTGGKDFKLEKFIIHPKFSEDKDGITYDIAVIKLKEKLVFNEKINKIKMADSNMTLNDGDMMQAIGFGTTENNELSNQLLSVKLPFVNRETCKKIYENFTYHVKEEMICAGGEEGKGSCHGDSGSPIFYNGYFYGVTSWTNPCAKKGYPTVFTSAPFMKDFIEDVIKKNS